jgi:hypothetical protein
MPQPHPYRDFECTGWEGAASAYAATFEHATSLFVPALADAVSARPGARAPLSPRFRWPSKIRSAATDSSWIAVSVLGASRSPAIARERAWPWRC